MLLREEVYMNVFFLMKHKKRKYTTLLNMDWGICNYCTASPILCKKCAVLSPKSGIIVERGRHIIAKVVASMYCLLLVARVAVQEKKKLFF